MKTKFQIVVFLIISLISAASLIPANVDYQVGYANQVWLDPAIDIHGFGKPVWENDLTLKIPNLRVDLLVKHLWIEIEWNGSPDPPATFGTEVPGTLPPSQVTPADPHRVHRGPTHNIFVWEWIINPQPAWEKIIFPDATFRNMTNQEGIVSMTVATKCVPEPTSMLLLLTGGLLLKRKHKRV